MLLLCLWFWASFFLPGTVALGSESVIAGAAGRTQGFKQLAFGPGPDQPKREAWLANITREGLRYMWYFGLAAAALLLLLMLARSLVGAVKLDDLHAPMPSPPPMTS